MTRRFWVLLLAVFFAFALGGCKKKGGGTATADEPTLEVRDGSEGLLLTWIDDKGEFHTEMHVADVPLMGRDSVKVVDTNKLEGTHADKVFVADLRAANPDGRYPVHTMSRADFDELAVARRAKFGPTLASAAEAGVPDSPPTGQGGGGAGSIPPGNARPLVVVYGAEWCGACHEAAAYLRRKGVPYVEKDIEKDPQANREMLSKLRAAGMRAGSIPVIDVRGKVMVGFSPGAVDEALGRST
ncbi:MAG TPA: glutaredoxin domain-containing protein [Polyangiaceae bacterium]|nr:glutaredoxin domain-containing protein [Polyangiaceae bacterium]